VGLAAVECLFYFSNRFEFELIKSCSSFAQKISNKILTCR
jgi:hypothetical protein